MMKIIKMLYYYGVQKIFYIKNNIYIAEEWWDLIRLKITADYLQDMKHKYPDEYWKEK